MATRRTVPNANDKGFSELPPGSVPSITSSGTSTMPVVPAHVIYKLLAFSFAMAVVPIGSYFLLLGPVFKGNSTYAGAFAAVMANVVLIGYVIVAIRESDEDEKPAGRVAVLDEKKGQ